MRDDELKDRLNEVQKIINGYFDSVKSEAFGRFRADFSFGKMLRSKLLLTIAPNSPIATKVCAIIELIHFASLLHDDVIDSAHLRRGKQSINAKYGDKNAIMLGDILYSKAFYEIACVSCGGANLAQIISNAVFELSLGELDDVFLGEKINLDSQKYLKMVERKTGALIEASAICGGILKCNSSLALNSSLGMQFRTCEKFWESADSGLALSQNFSQIQKPHRKYFDFDSQSESPTKQAQNAESTLDSAESQNLGENQTQNAESSLDSAKSQNLSENSARVAESNAFCHSKSYSCHSERSEESKNNSSLRADSQNLRGNPQGFARAVARSNHPPCEKTQNPQSGWLLRDARKSYGLPRSHSLARNDEFLDSSHPSLSQNDNFKVDSAIKKYKIYGRNLGIAFQIIDDLLDITQEDSTLGKESFSDFKEGKTTLPYIYLYNALNQGDREILKSYFKKPLNLAQKGWIRNKMSEFGIIEQVKNIAQDYGKMALSALDSSDSSDESDKNLVKIITDMIDREF